MCIGIGHPSRNFGGYHYGARNGLLMRNASALEWAAKAKIIALDKTGTLTCGKPRLHKIQTAPNVTESEVLTLAASVEKSSEHPLAKAITNAAQQRSLVLSKAEDFRAISGLSVQAKVEDQLIQLGSEKWLQESGLKSRKYKAPRSGIYSCACFAGWMLDWIIGV